MPIAEHMERRRQTEVDPEQPLAGVSRTPGQELPVGLNGLNCAKFVLSTCILVKEIRVPAVADQSVSALVRHLHESLQRLPDVLGSDLPGHEVDDLGRMTGVDLYGNASRRAGQGSKDVVIEPIDIYGKEIEPVGEPDAL